jgi:hypothetical protein
MAVSARSPGDTIGRCRTGVDPASCSTARDVLSTLEHNLAKPPESRLYDDAVVSVRLDRAALPLFRRLLRQRGAAFLVDVDGWVSEHERPDAPDAVRAGIIVQMFVDTESEEREATTGPRPV